MAARVRLKNGFMDDEKYHSLMTWLIYGINTFSPDVPHLPVGTCSQVFGFF